MKNCLPDPSRTLFEMEVLVAGVHQHCHRNGFPENPLDVE